MAPAAGVNEIAAGGSARRDGLDAQSGAVSNITNIPVELIEADHPIRIDEYALLADSEGAGAHRGGLGMVRQYRFLAEDTPLPEGSFLGVPFFLDIFIVALAIGVAVIAGVARITRGAVLSIKENVYVDAARALGGG